MIGAPRNQIVLACYEIPGWGGASTSAYNLFEMLRQAGLDCAYLNLIPPKTLRDFAPYAGEALGNPRRLPFVHNCLLGSGTHGSQSEVAHLLGKISPPLILAVGFMSALLVQRAAPRVPCIFITSGCRQLKEAVIHGQFGDLLSFNRAVSERSIQPVVYSKGELEAVEKADTIVTHSSAVRELFEFFYPSHRSKMYRDEVWFFDWIFSEPSRYGIGKPSWTERRIDALFVASDWERLEKNYSMVERILYLSEGLNCHVVGRVGTRSDLAVHHGLITEREKLFSIMADTKTVICPSCFDAAPGVLFEAAALGCNIVASRNCGNWQICHPELLSETLNEAEFRSKLEHSLSGQFKSNIDFFRSTRSFDAILKIISERLA